MSDFTQKIQFLQQADMVIPFRPGLSSVLGHNPYRILFVQQVYYKWQQNGCKAFHTFLKPCTYSQHYRIGQSWTEILGCTVSKLRTVRYGAPGRSGVVTKVTKNLANDMGLNSKIEAVKVLLDSEELEHLILNVSDSDGRTWHFLNEKLFTKLLRKSAKKQLKKYSRNLQETLNDQEIDVKDYVFLDYAQSLDTEEAEIELPAVRSYTKRQKEMFGAVVMPQDFFIPKMHLDKLEEEGYNKEELEIEARQFYNHYKNGNGVGKKSKNWVDQFIDVWISNAYERYETITKNGEFKSGKKETIDDIWRDVNEWAEGFEG